MAANHSTEPARPDPGQMLYGYAARAMQIYSIADMLAQHIESSDEPGPACGLIAGAAMELNTDLFCLAQRINGMNGSAAADVPAAGVSGETPSNAELAEDLKRVREAMWQVGTLARLVGKTDLEDLAEDREAGCDLENAQGRGSQRTPAAGRRRCGMTSGSEGRQFLEGMTRELIRDYEREQLGRPMSPRVREWLVKFHALPEDQQDWVIAEIERAVGPLEDATPRKGGEA